MIKKINGEQDTFLLLTDNTAYAFMIEPSGHPEHLYYGSKIDADALDELFALRQKRVLHSCRFLPRSGGINGKTDP